MNTLWFKNDRIYPSNVETTIENSKGVKSKFEFSIGDERSLIDAQLFGGLLFCRCGYDGDGNRKRIQVLWLIGLSTERMQHVFVISTCVSIIGFNFPPSILPKTGNISSCFLFFVPACFFFL